MFCFQWCNYSIHESVKFGKYISNRFFYTFSFVSRLRNLFKFLFYYEEIGNLLIASLSFFVGEIWDFSPIQSITISSDFIIQFVTIKKSKPSIYPLNWIVINHRLIEQLPYKYCWSSPTLKVSWLMVLNFSLMDFTRCKIL